MLKFLCSYFSLATYKIVENIDIVRHKDMNSVVLHVVPNQPSKIRGTLLWNSSKMATLSLVSSQVGYNAMSIRCVTGI